MSKEQLIASELLSRAEITLSNVLASNDMERDNFNFVNLENLVKFAKLNKYKGCSGSVTTKIG